VGGMGTVMLGGMADTGDEAVKGGDEVIL